MITYEWIDPWAAMDTTHQALMEIDHAHRQGTRWYTRGETGLREHVRMWIDRGFAALRGVNR